MPWLLMSPGHHQQWYILYRTGMLLAIYFEVIKSCDSVPVPWSCDMTSQLPSHYNDVIMGMMATQITSLTIVYSTVIRAQIKENIKAPRHWPLCGEFTGTGEFLARIASNAENVSIDDVIMSWQGYQTVAECFSHKLLLRITFSFDSTRHDIVFCREGFQWPTVLQCAGMI